MCLCCCYCFSVNDEMAEADAHTYRLFYLRGHNSDHGLDRSLGHSHGRSLDRSHALDYLCCLGRSLCPGHIYRKLVRVRVTVVAVPAPGATHVSPACSHCYCYAHDCWDHADHCCSKYSNVCWDVCERIGDVPQQKHCSHQKAMSKPSDSSTHPHRSPRRLYRLLRVVRLRCPRVVVRKEVKKGDRVRERDGRRLRGHSTARSHAIYKHQRNQKKSTSVRTKSKQATQ